MNSGHAEKTKERRDKNGWENVSTSVSGCAREQNQVEGGYIKKFMHFVKVCQPKS